MKGNFEELQKFLSKIPGKWAGGNYSLVTEFILLGFMELKVPLFLLFLIIYIITLVGNLGMIVLITNAPRLHTPMYFFLSNLSFIDICYSSSVTPKLLLGLLVERNSISFIGCITQFYFYAVFGTTEALLLAAMAYDRYMAICNPLLYATAMPHRVCLKLVGSSYVAGTLNALVHTGTMLHLSFCGPNIINHFYCEIPPLLSLSCTDTWPNEIVMYLFVGFTVIISTLAILISYAYILITILRIRSAEGKIKAFSTCASHMMVVSLFYGSVAFMYLRPSSRYSQGLDKIASVFYTVVSPMLNPLIYSVRNKEVKDTLRRATRKIFSLVDFHCSHKL
ncbi:olfactory receptor 1052-like [Alligator sinensis]|uniref:Olfactory receptor n=1 Tax=Alligator sinensis TaxID=38654 RepID=A0A1U7S6V5_ALLSI|nr:olfactory receptor 1052-like [Alligator sinensis]